MATIFHHFCKDRDAFINASDTPDKIAVFPEECITTFLEGIIKDVTKHDAV